MDMTAKEKAKKGLLYDANHDTALMEERLYAKDLLFEYNHLHPRKMSDRQSIMRILLGNIRGDFLIEQPFYCDYGYNINIGDKFYANFNCVILDAAAVTFGDNVFVGPQCGFYTAEHPLDMATRNRGLETARPIKVGNNVWVGGHVSVMPGVTIGDNSVIGAGSVVTRDIPANVVAAGNPCRVIRALNDGK